MKWTIICVFRTWITIIGSTSAGRFVQQATNTSTHTAISTPTRTVCKYDTFKNDHFILVNRIWMSILLSQILRKTSLWLIVSSALVAYQRIQQTIFSFSCTQENRKLLIEKGFNFLVFLTKHVCFLFKQFGQRFIRFDKRYGILDRCPATVDFRTPSWPLLARRPQGWRLKRPLAMRPANRSYPLIFRELNKKRETLQYLYYDVGFFKLFRKVWSANSKVVPRRCSSRFGAWKTWRTEKKGKKMNESASYRAQFLFVIFLLSESREGKENHNSLDFVFYLWARAPMRMWNVWLHHTLILLIGRFDVIAGMTQSWVQNKSKDRKENIHWSQAQFHAQFI